MYKTILVHCNDKRRIRALMAPAVDLAESSEAHLHALSVVPPMAVISGGAESPPVLVDEHCQLYREENPAMRAAFDDAVRGRGLVAEWQDGDAGALGVADCVVPYARSADLVIASQTDPAWPGSNCLDIADRLVLESGRPVLIVPNAGVHARVGREGARGLERRPRGRACRFRRASHSPAGQGRESLVGQSAIGKRRRKRCPGGRYLHGLGARVKCEATEQLRPGIGVGETLLASAKDFGADLLIMGCYGHSRLREFVFGGASRHVLQNMSIPVLMSH